MKKKKIIVLITVIIAILVASNFITIDANIYKSTNKYTCNYQQNYTNITINTKVGKPNIDLYKSADYKMFIYGIDKDSVKVNSSNTYRINGTTNFKVSPMRYVPLIKYIDYNFIYEFTDSNLINLKNTYNLTKGTGTVSINGTIKIYGICSAEKAKEIIETMMKNEVKNGVKKIVSDNIKFSLPIKTA